MNKIILGNKIIDCSEKKLIMGILNVTPDSFSDGGKFDSLPAAIHQAKKMVAQGADIIDIGGESTRPGAKKVPVQEEIKRTITVIKQLTKELSVPISIDTYKSEVAYKAIDAGATLVNDITALKGDPSMASVIAETDVSVCLMHMKGTPQTMQQNPIYEDIVTEIKSFLKEQAAFAQDHHIAKDKIIIDPGLGFGKRTGQGIEDNCEILKRLHEFKTLGHPILIGASRKTFIGNVCGTDVQLPVIDRLEGSLAAACIAGLHGADIIRAHDVKETRRCMNLVECVLHTHKQLR
jgi:dihydropteroate synthase